MASCSRSASPWPADGLTVRVIDKITHPGDAHNARATWATRRSVVLVLTDADGRIGLGEAAPLAGLSTETADQARDDLLTRSPTPCPSARFALDSALFDLRGQRDNQPVWALLGADAPEALEVNLLIQTRPETWSRRVTELGAGCIKLKIGFSDLDVDAHVAAVRELLERLPAGVRLRLDANGAFTAEEAWRLRLALADERIEYVEDPVAAAALGFPVHMGLPWAADQLLLDRPAAISSFGPRQGLVALIVKPTLHGSFAGIVELAAEAGRRAVDTVFTHAFEGAIAHAAIVHLAYATAGQRPRAMGLAEHDNLRAWPSRLTAQRRPDAAGLGLDAKAILAWLDADA